MLPWGLGLWATFVLAGFGALGAYSATPGPAAGAPATWPDGAPIELQPGTPTFLVFAHPRCPCTRAALRNLERLAARWPFRPALTVLFFAPGELDPPAAEAFARTDLWNLAERIPGARVVLDPGGRIAERFGASTSGEALVFGPEGELRFVGGLTSARGHEGLGTAAALSQALAGPLPAALRAPVFGCLLLDDAPPE